MINGTYLEVALFLDLGPNPLLSRWEEGGAGGVVGMGRGGGGRPGQLRRARRETDDEDVTPFGCFVT